MSNVATALQCVYHDIIADLNSFQRSETLVSLVVQSNLIFLAWDLCVQVSHIRQEATALAINNKTMLSMWLIQTTAFCHVYNRSTCGFLILILLVSCTTLGLVGSVLLFIPGLVLLCLLIVFHPVLICKSFPSLAKDCSNLCELDVWIVLFHLQGSNKLLRHDTQLLRDARTWCNDKSTCPKDLPLYKYMEVILMFIPSPWIFWLTAMGVRQLPLHAVWWEWASQVLVK